MQNEITHDEAYECHVLKSAKRMALTHVADVLAVSESILRTVRKDIDPAHDGMVSGPGAVLQAQAIVRNMLHEAPRTIEISALDCVTACDSLGLELWQQYSIAEVVNEYIKDVLCQLMLQRGRYEKNNGTHC